MDFNKKQWGVVNKTNPGGTYQVTVEGRDFPYLTVPAITSGWFEVGDIVAICYLHGDPQCPLILGAGRNGGTSRFSKNNGGTGGLVLLGPDAWYVEFANPQGMAFTQGLGNWNPGVDFRDVVMPFEIDNLFNPVTGLNDRFIIALRDVKDGSDNKMTFETDKGKVHLETSVSETIVSLPFADPNQGFTSTLFLNAFFSDNSKTTLGLTGDKSDDNVTVIADGTDVFGSDLSFFNYRNGDNLADYLPTINALPIPDPFATKHIPHLLGVFGDNICTSVKYDPAIVFGDNSSELDLTHLNFTNITTLATSSVDFSNASDSQVLTETFPDNTKAFTTTHFSETPNMFLYNIASGVGIGITTKTSSLTIQGANPIVDLPESPYVETQERHQNVDYFLSIINVGAGSYSRENSLINVTIETSDNGPATSEANLIGSSPGGNVFPPGLITTYQGSNIQYNVPAFANNGFNRALVLINPTGPDDNATAEGGGFIHFFQQGIQNDYLLPFSIEGGGGLVGTPVNFPHEVVIVGGNPTYVPLTSVPDSALQPGLMQFITADDKVCWHRLTGLTSSEVIGCSVFSMNGVFMGFVDLRLGGFKISKTLGASTGTHNIIYCAYSTPGGFGFNPASHNIVYMFLSGALAPSFQIDLGPTPTNSQTTIEMISQVAVHDKEIYLVQNNGATRTSNLDVPSFFRLKGQ